jgi:predicted MFS family arabinose efflux permease
LTICLQKEEIMLVRILAYFVPFAINFLNGGFFFITAQRFAAADCPAVIVASSVTAWGVAYCLVTMIISRMVKNSNALALILTGGVILTLTSVGFLTVDGLYLQFIWLICSGIGAALFCTPFQLFAKSIENQPDKAADKKKSGTVSATAFYTMTWSLGFASGPLAFARVSEKTGFLITMLLALAVTVSVMLIGLMKKRSAAAESIENGVAEAADEIEGNSLFSEKNFTMLAILGWIVGGLGTITVCQIRSVWPKLGEDMGFAKSQIAYVLAVVSYVQAFTALALCRSKSWMWKRIPALLMSLSGIAALLMFAFGRTLPVFYLAACCYGLYTGCVYFYLVYHSLAHPTRSRFFVAGNEVLVGITSMIAPVLGGFLVDFFDFNGAAFIFAAVMIVIAMICQMVILNPLKLAGQK